LPAARATARYRLLAQAARACGATHILTAHTRDDQAETLLMRLLRGSGIGGLARCAESPSADGVLLARPFCTLRNRSWWRPSRKQKIGFADDPTNRDTNFYPASSAEIMPVLAADGGRCAQSGAAGVAAWPGLTRL